MPNWLTLTELAVAPADADWFKIIDSSDTTYDPLGTDKKIKWSTIKTALASPWELSGSTIQSKVATNNVDFQQGALFDQHVVSGVTLGQSTSGIALNSRFVATSIIGSLNELKNKQITSIDNTDSPYTILDTDEVILVDCSGGDVTLDAPAISSSLGREITILKTDSSSSQWIFDPNGGETVNGRSIYQKMHQYDTYTFTGGSTEWVATSEVENVKTRWFVVQYDNNYNNYRTQNISGAGSQNFTFNIPNDYEETVTLAAVIAPSAGAAGSGKDIDLFSNYGTLGESVTANSESDTTTTYDFTGLADTFTTLDLSTVFTGIDADDICGVQVDHNGIGGNINYFGILLVYRT